MEKRQSAFTKLPFLFEFAYILLYIFDIYFPNILGDSGKSLLENEAKISYFFLSVKLINSLKKYYKNFGIMLRLG